MPYDPHDPYFKMAKQQNYAARSVFKLEEIDQRYHVLAPGQKILDLGAAPGSWSQYASKAVGPSGRILGIDLQAIGLTLPNVVFRQADLFEVALPEALAEAGIQPPVDLVLSDMAPKTTGVRATDQARSAGLVELAIACADEVLRPGGGFVCKLFHSGEFETLRASLRERYAKVHILRPKSTRKESKEVFFVATGYRGASA